MIDEKRYPIDSNKWYNLYLHKGHTEDMLEYLYYSVENKLNEETVFVQMEQEDYLLMFNFEPSDYKYNDAVMAEYLH